MFGGKFEIWGCCKDWKVKEERINWIYDASEHIKEAWPVLACDREYRIGEKMLSVWWRIIVIMVVAAMKIKAEEVGYDGRSLIINGKRSILFSGSIHYPRSTPPVYYIFHFSIIYF